MIQRLIRLSRLGALLPVLALGACISGGGSAEYVAFDEASAIQAVNAFRAENGLRPVSLSPTLGTAAETHSERMAAAGSLSHSLGGALPSRLRAAGFNRWWAAAENIGMGYTTYGSAIAGWKASPGHRRNLLNPNVTQAGMAAARTGGGRPYWTIILATPR